MELSGKKILLFNPWIYDFAAYDFWVKPIGLLQLAAVLKERGAQLEFIDCLDRFHPALLAFPQYPPAKLKENGTGKFIREEITKPEAYKHIPRKYCRYGLPMQVIQSLLEKMAKPDVILLTSVMTYWYPAVRDAALLLREYFPNVPIVLGGIYATLCPEHAQKIVAPNYMCSGAGERQIIGLVSEILGQRQPDFNYNQLDELPPLLYDLYPDLRSVAITTSRGCPNRCTFCASSFLNSQYARRSSGHVLEEIMHWYNKRQVKHFAFFDDALLHKADDYIKPLLRGIVEMQLPVKLHASNGLQPRYIDKEFAELFYQAGGITVKLSFETLNPARQNSMSSKVNCRELETALQNLEQAGYKRNSIGVYVLMGLPDQDFTEVQDTVNYVLDLGAIVNLASFSPIPHTSEWQHAVDLGYWGETDDLLMTNTTVFPIWSKRFGYDKCQEFIHSLVEKNKQQTSVVSENEFQLM